MRTVINVRLAPWQKKIFTAFAQRHELTMSRLIKFFFNHLILKHKGRVTRKLIDDVEFQARKRFSKE